MGHAAAKTRTAVLTTAAQSLQAVEEVRTLANALAAEQVALKAQLADLDARNRELAAALEQQLAAVRTKADASTVDAALVAVMADLTRVENSATGAHVRFSTDGRLRLLDAGWLGRLRWLVAGR